ncbi:MAG: histidine triad nucleotide-binding protein [Verrucomicrobia bacterium]|nr:histidine triad nucleotide-binding protein [Verrucomicrobiota bacterium]
MKNVFQRIIDEELPCDKVFENERIIAFKDIAPAAPVHILIVPKKHFPNISAIGPEDGELILEVVMVANELAKKFKITDGYRLLTNNGEKAGQTVFHLHFHLLGGTHLGPIA